MKKAVLLVVFFAMFSGSFVSCTRVPLTESVEQATGDDDIETQQPTDHDDNGQ